VALFGRAAERAGGAFRPTHYKEAPPGAESEFNPHTVENELPTARLLIA
jgi:hypothetical protein